MKKNALLPIAIVGCLLMIGTGYAQTPNDSLYSQQSYLNTVGVPHAWLTTQGNANQKITILLFGGVNLNHEDLSPRVVVKTAGGEPSQYIGAGDPVIGIVGAATNNKKGIAGVNWVSPILSYDVGKWESKKVYKFSDGTQINQNILDLNTGAIASDINNAVSSGAKTILIPISWVQSSNITSLSPPNMEIYPDFKILNPVGFIIKNEINVGKAILSENSDYQNAAEALRNAYVDGSVVVGKATEYNGKVIGFPAEFSSEHVAVGVGASDLSGRFYEYSSTPEPDGISYNDKDIDVIAPGVNMETTLPTANAYGKFSGTGASAALVTGIVSLLQAANPSLTTDDIKFILHKTAVPVGSGGYQPQTGYGLVDAGAAMDYVNFHTITHGTITSGSVQKIVSNKSITLLSGIWGDLSSDVYTADIYKVTFTIPLDPFSYHDVWYDASGTYGWSQSNPNDQTRYAEVQYQNSGSSQATVTTYIYYLTNINGQQFWRPSSPSNLHLGYTIASKPITQNTDNIFITDATISSNKTYSNEDLYLKDGVTLTAASTLTLNNCTVHLGVGAVIQTTGSGNIQATGTEFETLSGLTDPSHRWLHIILKGNGGSNIYTMYL